MGKWIGTHFGRDLMFRTALKRSIICILAALILPAALLSGLGRVERVFTFFAHFFALFPGIVGDYCRSAYYVLTLRDCSIDARVGFGSYFAHTDVTLKPGVVIGAYCVLGCVSIGARTQVASLV